MNRLAPVSIILVLLFLAQCEHFHNTKFVLLFSLVESVENGGRNKIVRSRDSDHYCVDA